MNTIMEHISGNKYILCTVMPMVSRHFMTDCRGDQFFLLCYFYCVLVPIVIRKMTVEVKGHQNHDRGREALGKLSFDILSAISQLIVFVFTTLPGL